MTNSTAIADSRIASRTNLTSPGLSSARSRLSMLEKSHPYKSDGMDVIVTPHNCYHLLVLDSAQLRCLTLACDASADAASIDEGWQRCSSSCARNPSRARMHRWYYSLIWAVAASSPVLPNSITNLVKRLG